MKSTITNKDVDFFNSTKIKTNFGSVLNDVKYKDIVVIRNGEPEAVIISYEDYKNIEDLLEKLEDIELGKIAVDRIKKSKKTYTLNQAIQELGDDYEV